MVVFLCGSRAVEQMIIHRPDLINFTKEDGYSPLHMAAANNRVDIADFLAQQVCAMIAVIHVCKHFGKKLVMCLYICLFVSGIKLP